MWSWVALALFVGVTCGTVLTIAAGARRTDSAHSRFLATHAPSDFLIGDSSDFGLTGLLDLDAVARLPEVETTARVRFLMSGGRTDSGRRLLPGYVVAFAPLDDRLGVSVDRWKLLSGRRADPRRVDEVVVSFELARQLDLDVGSTLRLTFLRTETFFTTLSEFFAELPERAGGAHAAGGGIFLSRLDGPSVTFHVVGIEASPLEFPPIAGNLIAPLHLTPAFEARYGEGLFGQDILHVRLREEADRKAFQASVERLAGTTTARVLQVGSENAINVDRSIHLQAVALWVLAGLVGVSVAFAIAQAVTRHSAAWSADFPTLIALGMTRSELLAVAALRSAVTGVLAVGTAVAVAVSLSPLWPFGLARNAEPNPGLDADVVVLGLGAGVIVLLAVGADVFATARALDRANRARSATSDRTFTRSARWKQLPVPAGIGVGHALEPGRGRTAVPVRSAILATALAVTTMITATTIASSVDHLLETPRLYGWTHDAQIGVLGLPAFAGLVVPALEGNDAVASIAAGTATELDVAGSRVSAFALDPVRGSLRQGFLEGHAPQRVDQIALGTQTLRDTGVELGDRVEVRLAGTTTRMRVVGRKVFPDIGDNGQLGRGAQITFAALQRLVPDAPANIVLLGFARGTDTNRARTELEHALAPLPLLSPEPPTDLTSFGRVNDLPTIVAAIMLVVAAAILTHTMLTSIRRRRRDFAILQTLGWVRRDVTTAVSVQATTFAVVALCLGIPFGIVAARAAWTAVANLLGVPAETVTSIPSLAVAALAVVTVANLAALVPARLARRTRPATTLRAE